MKFFRFLALLLLPLSGLAQTNITQVAVGEYYTSFLRANGTVIGTHWGGYLGVNRDTTALHGVTGIVEVTGGQYVNLARNAAGQVWTIYKDNGNGGRQGTAQVATDYQGNAFTGNTSIYGGFTSFFSIKGGVPYMWGASNFLSIPGWNGNPIPLQVPAGKTMKKLVVMEPVNNPVAGVVLALTTDSLVYTYNKAGGGVPILRTGLTGVADICAITQFVYVAITPTKIYNWGGFTDMVGLANGVSTPTDVTAAWTAAGVQFPIKKSTSNWTCFFILDNKNDLFGIGNNPHGNLANGQQWPNWSTKSPDPFAWDFQRGTYPQTTPVQIRGKFSNVWSDGNLSNFVFATDMGGVQLYSAGRNKATSLTNGVQVSNDEGYPEFANVPFFQKVNPNTVTWPAGGGPAFNPATPQKPLATAGIDQWVTGTSATLYGQGHQQGTTTIPTGSITSYAWTKVSGPAGGAIVSPTAATTAVTGLVTGTYVYRMTVTSNVAGQTASRDMNMYVTASNTAPVANAGSDQTKTLPTNTATMAGSGSDADGTISSVAWTKQSGPAGGAITTPTSYTTTITGLSAGTYVYRLTVTDNNGDAGFDDMTILVNPAPNTAPTVNAGADQTKTLPTNTATMAGSGSDPDGTITTILWTKQSGPTGGAITTPGSYATGITGLVAGTYVYRLTVTDNNGATAFDDMSILVNPAPNTPPTASAGNDTTVILPATLVLVGSGSDAQGGVTYSWVRTSGPNTPTISSPNSASTNVSGLTIGTYVFTLTVTDAGGLSAADSVTVVVSGTPPSPKVTTIRLTMKIELLE